MGNVMSSALYLYGVVGTTPPLPLAVEGVAGGVRVFVEGDLGVIVGAEPAGGLKGLAREQAVRLLLRHQQTLEAALSHTTVLPIRFGTVAPGEEAVRSMLTEGGALFRERLEAFLGRQQMEIVVSWDLGRVFAEIAMEADVAKARRAIEEGAEGGESARVELGRTVKAALERRRAALAEKLGEELRTIAVDMTENAIMDDRMVANFALLIDREDAASLEGVLNRLDADFGGSLNFRCIGPLPPANFATVEVAFPSAQTIDQARRTLRIDGGAGRNEIVSAYRRLARQNHPDTAASPEAGAERLSEIASAYRLLMAHARTQTARGDAGGAPAVIVDVARQEAPGPGLAL